MTHALQLKNVRKAYQGHVAVKGLDLEVPRGSVFGLLGPNGAGKTTSIRMAMDIIGPDTGEVLILGTKADKAMRNRIGYMPEERGLYQKMVVEDLLVFMAELKGMKPSESRRRMRPWLEKLGIAEWQKRKANEMSKGMQQKVQFIQALLHDPEILILDEPMSGLDPVGTNVMRDAMIELSRAGKTLIVSSHQMATVEQMCDRVALINKGEKVLDGRVSEIKSSYGKNTLILAFEGDGSFLKSLPGVMAVTDTGRYAELKLGPTADSQLILKAASEKLKITRFEVVEPSLHDIFIERVTEVAA
ncbi:MAG: ATP-binding cassette domain-containing protein [Vicinamibacteria bacterium]